MKILKVYTKTIKKRINRLIELYKDIAELVSVEELTDSEYNYKAVNVFIV